MARPDSSPQRMLHVHSPALARVLPQPRAWHGAGETVLLLAAAAAFLISAAGYLAPEIGQAASRLRGAALERPGQPAPVLSAAEVETVMSYARQMRDDDRLMQVRPGVLAKRSNVAGLQLNGRTVYYDILPHQSYGPLRAGKLAESEVTILAREQVGGTLVLVYVARSG